jgi:hypothetical protein
MRPPRWDFELRILSLVFDSILRRGVGDNFPKVWKTNRELQGLSLNEMTGAAALRAGRTAKSLP